MDIFEKIGKKFNLIKETSKTEQILKDRENIKLNLAVNLYKAGFSDEQIEIVLQIITNAENDIQKIKDGLIGTNINPLLVLVVAALIGFVVFWIVIAALKGIQKDELWEIPTGKIAYLLLTKTGFLEEKE